jgi:hypothetical protein
LAELRLDAIGATVDLRNASLPLLLGASVAYMTVRCGMEYAMMERQVRRWPLARLDMRSMSLLARFVLIVLAASALQRSFRSVALVVVGLVSMAAVAALLTVVLAFLVMPIRVHARKKADRESAANAVEEAFVWGGLFAVLLTIVGVVSLGIASYRVAALRSFVWPVPPNPYALLCLVTILLAVFLSHWLLRPLERRLYAQRPGYYTERQPDGGLLIHYVNEEEEPLL